LNPRKWILPVICAAVILTLGTSLFSITRTGAIIDPLISWLSPGIGPDALYQVHVFIRRSAHVIEYGALFLLLNLGPLRGRPLVAFFVCIAVASLDESLQMLLPSRSGLMSDVAEDTSGATIMMVVGMSYWECLHHVRDSARAANVSR
jgi:VanZ family protein